MSSGPGGGVLGKLLKRKSPVAEGGPEIGLARSPRGDMAVWATWPAQRPSEVFRFSIRAESPGRDPVFFSYTFTPSLQAPFAQYVSVPFEFRDLMRGTARAIHGVVTIECILSGTTLAKVYRLTEAAQPYIGKGPLAPERATPQAEVLLPDSPDVAKLRPAELKARSDEARKAIEEKRKKEEEERKAKEAAAKAEAEKKAAAAREAAAKAAAAKAAGGASKPAGTEAPAGGMPPCKVAIVYGSSTGNTANVAKMIQTELSDISPQVKNVTELQPSDYTVPEILIIGIPTWHIGELQDDWAACLPDVAKQNYAGKRVAIFGLGDGKGYPDTYVDAMQDIWEKLEAKGAKLFGLWPTDGYEFQKSRAIKDGKFLGLVIDVENQDHLSEGRVKQWVGQLRSELKL